MLAILLFVNTHVFAFPEAPAGCGAIGAPLPFRRCFIFISQYMKGTSTGKTFSCDIKNTLTGKIFVMHTDV